MGQLVLPSSGGKRKRGKQNNKNKKNSGGSSGSSGSVYDGGAALSSNQQSRLWLTACWIKPALHGALRLVSSSWMGELLLWEWSMLPQERMAGARTKRGSSSSGGGGGGGGRSRGSSSVIPCRPTVLCCPNAGSGGGGVQHNGSGHTRPVFNIVQSWNGETLLTTSMYRNLGECVCSQIFFFFLFSY